MSKVMRQMVKQRSNSSHNGYYPMRAPGPESRGGAGGQGGKSAMFTRDISFSESEIQTHVGFSDSEEEKSEVIDDFLDDEDEQDDREEELIQSEFEEGDDDDEDEEEGNDPFQRQLGYPPLPRYKTPTPANPLDKLGTLTPMEEMTEPPSSGANSPASFAIPGHRSKSRGPSNLTIDHSGMDMNRSPSRSSKKNLGLDTGNNERSPSRNSMNNLMVDHGGRSRAQSRTSMRGASPTPSKSPSRQGMSDYGKSAQSRSDFPPSDFPTSAMSRSDYPPSDYPKTPGKSGKRHEFQPSTMDDEDFAPDSGHGEMMGKSGGRNLSSPDSMLSFRGDTMKMRKSGSSGIGSGGGMEGGSGSGSRSNLLNSSKSPKRTSTPLPKFDSEMDSDINTLGLQSDANTLDDTEEMEKMRSFDRVRSWQRHAGGSSPPVYSALADAEFASALDGMIMKLHGSKVDWEYRVKLADDLTAALKNVSPQVLLKNMSQIIPLVSNIAAESHFRVSLSILNTITILGDRLRDCKSFLGSKSIPNADLTWLIRRLCTVCGESRSTLRTEGALALSHLIKGAGPELVCDPLYLILSSESKKHLNGTGRLTAGPRIKAAALDALTFALLTFPRDDFDLPTLAKHACKSLWNSKRRVRQASLECLAVLAHALGPSVALPLFRNYIEETKMELSSSSSSSGTTKRGSTNYAPVATPSSAVSARVSRHLLPSPSPAGLVEYAVMIPQRTLQQSSYESGKGKGGLDPILNGNGSGKNRHSAMVGADIAWILAGTGPTVNSTFYSPGSNLDWLAEETGNGDWPSEGETSLLKGSSGRHYSKSKMKNSHSYNGTMDLLDTHMKSPWSSSNSGSYMDRYHKSSSNGFLADGHPSSGGGKGDKGFSLLPNKYPSHSSSNGELPNLSSPFNHHNSHSTFGDFNSNLWSQHEEFMGFNNNNHHKGGYSTTSNSKPSKHGRQLHPPMSHDKYSDSSRRFDAFSQNNTSIDQSDSDHEQYSSHRPSYQNYGQGEGHFIKINREYDDIDEECKKDGLDSAGSTNTRDSGVSSLKSSKTIPSPPSMGGGPYEARQSAPKMTSSKKKSPSPQLGHPSESLSHSRSWRSTPDVPELAKADDDSRKSNEIGSDISRSQSGSSGFLHRKPVLARASQRKTSSDSIQNRLSGLELRDFDDGTESESQQYIKEKIPKPVSFHLSLSTNNIANSEEDEADKPKMPYSTSSLRRNTSNKTQTKQPYLKSRSRSRTPVGNRGLASEMSSMKGDAESLTSLTESSPPKNNLTVKKGTMPKRVYKGSFRESNNGRNTMTNTMNAEVFPADLKPVDSPRHSLSLALNNLNSSEWETNLDGFRLLVRLSRHHPESLRNDLHNININGMRHLLNLRSQVCRSACLFFKELFLSQGKLIEQDLEKIAEKLLDKSSDTNRFIREDSGSAIETMVLHLTPAKVLHCLDTYGLKHRNPMVRTTASKMLTLLIRRLGSERCLYDHPEKILPMIMHFLQEGSLDTRTHAKAALAELVSHKGFDSQLRRHVSQDTLRNVSKSIAAIKNEMPSL